MKKPSARETRGAILLATLTAAVLAVTLTQTPPSGDTLPHLRRRICAGLVGRPGRLH